MDDNTPKERAKRYIVVAAILVMTSFLFLSRPVKVGLLRLWTLIPKFNSHHIPKLKIEEIEIGDEITYENIFVKNGYSNGLVIGKIDHNLLSIENLDKVLHDQKFIDVSDVLSVK
jgi:hypothetical protein